MNYYDKAHQQALRLHKSGWGYKTISDAIGYSPTTVRSWIHNAGVARHPRSDFPVDVVNAAVNEYQSDDRMSITSIARKYGACRKTVRRWLIRLGVESRPRPTNRHRVLEDLSTGLTIKECALKRGLSESYVGKIRLGL